MSSLSLARSRAEFFERVAASLKEPAWWLAAIVTHIAATSIVMAVDDVSAVAYRDARFFTIAFFVNALSWAVLIGIIGNPFVDDSSKARITEFPSLAAYRALSRDELTIEQFSSMTADELRPVTVALKGAQSDGIE